MKTFLQHLNEKFLKTIRGSWGPIEIWVNPTPDEMGTVVEVDGDEIGCWLTPQNVYVWDRNGSQHDKIGREIPDRKGAIPLYLYYTSRTKTLKVSISRFTMSQMGLDNFNAEQIVRDAVSGHPKLQKYNIVY